MKALLLGAALAFCGCRPEGTSLDCRDACLPAHMASFGCHRLYGMVDNCICVCTVTTDGGIP